MPTNALWLIGILGVAAVWFVFDLVMSGYSAKQVLEGNFRCLYVWGSWRRRRRVGDLESALGEYLRAGLEPFTYQQLLMLIHYHKEVVRLGLSKGIEETFRLALMPMYKQAPESHVLQYALSFHDQLIASGLRNCWDEECWKNAIYQGATTLRLPCYNSWPRLRPYLPLLRRDHKTLWRELKECAISCVAFFRLADLYDCAEAIPKADLDAMRNFATTVRNIISPNNADDLLALLDLMQDQERIWLLATEFPLDELRTGAINLMHRRGWLVPKTEVEAASTT